MFGRKQDKQTPGSQANDMHWEILDIEEDEWEQHVAATMPPVEPWPAAAAETATPNAATPNAAAPDATSETGRKHRRRPVALHPKVRAYTRLLAGHGMRSLALRAAIALALVLGSTYVVWAKANAGLDSMKSEITAKIKVEALRENSRFKLKQNDVAVTATDFLNNKARAAVVVTQTLSTGTVVTERQNRFYVQTPQGWQRTDPDPAFWGPVKTLDTTNLHFIYHVLDADAVQQMAADGDAFYAQVRQVLAPASAVASSSSARLTVEIVPQIIMPDEELMPGGVRVTSPALIDTATSRPPAGVLAWYMRRALVDAAFADLRQPSAFKPQWHAIVDGLHSWLMSTTKMPLTASQTLADPLHDHIYAYPRLDALLACLPCSQQSAHNPNYPNNIFTDQMQWTYAPLLIDHLVGKYGIEKLPALVQGMTRYDNWDDLAVATYGVPAPTLEADWRHVGQADAGSSH